MDGLLPSIRVQHCVEGRFVTSAWQKKEEYFTWHAWVATGGLAGASIANVLNRMLELGPAEYVWIA
jgi:hypothetical protein